VNQERRKLYRYNVENLKGSISFPEDTSVINLSMDGAAIETTKGLRIDREYVIRVDHRGTVFHVRGRTVWSTLKRCSKNGNGDVVPIYRAGFMFTDRLDEKLKNMLNEHCYSIRNLLFL